MKCMYSDFQKNRIVQPNIEESETITDDDVSFILKVVDSLLVEEHSSYTPLSEVGGVIQKFDEEFTGPTDLVVTIAIPSEHPLGTYTVSSVDSISNFEFRRFEPYFNDQTEDKTSTHVFRAYSSDTDKTYSIWINLGVSELM